MAHNHISADQVNPGKFELSNRGKTIFSVLSFLGLISFIIGLSTNKEQTWHAYLLSYFYFLSLGLGGVFFTAIQHVTKAGWSVTIRRFSEAMGAFLPFAAIGAVVLVFGAHDLYSWLDVEYVKKDPILAGKEAYLNQGFFIARLVVFFILWLLFARVIIGRSTKQDETGDKMLTAKNVGTSIAFVLVFALSYSLFSVDTLMSLEPHWFSTIFGVYAFAGLFQSSIAFMILVALYMMKKGHVKGLVTMEHVHDLGKFLKAFTVFWAYIAFSQFILIWYANLPEETIFYYHRSHGTWAVISLALIVFKFIVPFIALLPRWAKRTPGHLAAVCVLVMIMQYVDLYWLIYPNFNGEHASFGFIEVGLFMGFLGLFLFTTMGFLAKHKVIPVKDPRLQEALDHHVSY